MMFKQLNLGARFRLGADGSPAVKISPWQYCFEDDMQQIGSRHAKVEVLPVLPKTPHPQVARPLNS